MQKLSSEDHNIMVPLIATGIMAMIFGCKGVSTGSRKKSTPTPETTQTSTTETNTAQSTGGLAISYPEGMSVANSTTSAPTSSASDPTTVSYASGSLALPTNLALTSQPTTYNPMEVAPKDRIIEAAKRLKGESDDCLPAHMFNPAPVFSPNCYNPDGDMSGVYASYSGSTPSGTPQFVSASGVTQTGEACLAAYARAKTAEVAAIVDQAQALVEGMICASYKKDKAQKIPEPNETLDLLSVLSEVTGVSKVDPNANMASPDGAPDPVTGMPPPSMFRFMKAEIKREANTDTRARYISSIVMEVNGTVRQIRLVHMPSLTDGNDDYIGRLSIKTFRVQRANLTENKENYLDINYMLDMDVDDGGKPKTRYRLLRAEFNRSVLVSANVDPFAGIGQLNLNVGAIFNVSENDNSYGSLATDAGQNSNYTMSAVNQIDWAGNPLTFEGRFAFWVNPGGNYHEAARGLVANMVRESSDSTRLKGCAMSGAAMVFGPGGNLSIRKAQKTGVTLKPTGYFHPNAQDFPNPSDRLSARCQAGDCQIAPFSYKQCYRQDDAGLYVPDGNQDTTKNYDIVNLNTSTTAVDGLMPVVVGKIQAPQ